MSDTAVEIFRSARRAVCDERAFMLAAVGIGSLVEAEDAQFVLLVDSADAPAAADHLSKYEIEIRTRPRPARPALRIHPGAWIGSLVYASILFGVALAISNGWWRLDAFEVGELDAAGVQGGQWWRVWTALTLHLDGAHLAANTIAGVWFGYLAATLLGGGNAWLLIVAGAGLANWIEARFGPSPHYSVGASTAVFTALGLLSAYSWRMRFSYPQRWAARWGPLVAGLVLLSWTGSGASSDNPESGGGAAVDVVAHALGFAVGAGFGVLAALPAVGRMLTRFPQWPVGLAALVPLVAAWFRALGS
jgi:membrane associated rhomboid family serine protease